VGDKVDCYDHYNLTDYRDHPIHNRQECTDLPLPRVRGLHQEHAGAVLVLLHPLPREQLPRKVELRLGVRPLGRRLEELQGLRIVPGARRGLVTGCSRGPFIYKLHATPECTGVMQAPDVKGNILPWNLRAYFSTPEPPW
jgi:hypothetical protein